MGTHFAASSCYSGLPPKAVHGELMGLCAQVKDACKLSFTICVL